ncbi:MAG: peptidoglycan-binding protein [Candidatus Magasanikbacteria bacterium]|nr:peptidoglycan-binding protein [Candidatus Magasanikbacteria bacterium]
MAKKIIQHVWKKKIVYMLSVMAVAVGVGFYASFFIGRSASALSGVTLADNDTTGFGLDGRDFSITWTPGDQPAGFLYTKIFITTNTVNLTTSTAETTACAGSACVPVGYFSQWTNAAHVAPQFMGTDSSGVAWRTSTSYVAWVFASTTDPNNALLVSSTVVSYANTFDIVSDTSKPQIDHSPAHVATANKTAYFNAFVFDDQTSGASFASTSVGTEYFRLFYTSSTNPWSSVNSTTGQAYSGESDFYSFQVPTTSMGAAGATFKYYLVAADATGNTRYFCANPSAASATDCQNNPFTLTTVSAGSRTVGGTITSGGSALGSAFVFAGGFASSLPAVLTNGSGVYSLTALPNNDAFDIAAHKVGYCRSMRFETIGTTDKTGVDMSLGNSSCGFYDPGMGGGAGGAPMVMFSGPPEGMQGVSVSESIRVGFNQPMDGATINDTNAADSGSNVYLTTDDGTTKVAGTVTYCASNASAGCSSLFSMDNNTILFVPSSTLASSTFYTLVITSAVKGQGGQSVQGNVSGGGHKISFGTSGGALNIGSFGTSGQFMPPYVKSMTPAPGMTVGGNVSLTVEFSEAMSSASINQTNVRLFNITNGANTEVTLIGSNITLDSNERRFVTITHSALSAGTYEVRVLGAAANASGISMRPPANGSDIAFKSSFIVSGTDNTVPTVYPSFASGTTGMAVNNVFTFGFNEQLLFNTVNTTNVTLSRGATSVGVTVKYDSGLNNVFVVPNTALVPNTVYTLVFSSSVTDAASNRLPTSTYTYTTGGGDTVIPILKEAQCDDYTCKFFFTEPMNHASQVDGATSWVSSTLNHLRISLTQGGADKIVTSTAMAYDSVNFVITATGVGLTPLNAGGANFSATISGVGDLSGNVMASTVLSGPVKDSKETFGNFGGGGMFAPPTTGFTGGTIGGGEFTPMGFGSFTVDQFAFGQADMAFPFNSMASQDANVFQIKFNPGVAVAAGDKVVITFPVGTDVNSAGLDTFSPFYDDFNQFAAGIVTSTAVATDTVSRKVTVTLGVSGSPAPNDSLTIDLRKIINPAIPKDPSTGGYTVTIQLTNNAGTTVKASKTSMPYFIMAGGTNTLNVQVVAGVNTSTPTAGANGTVFMHGGGPAGPMDKSITLTNGVISAIDGTSATGINFTNLPNGCYFLGTDPFVTLGTLDYFGQMSPEPICLNGSVSTTKYILLSPATSGGGSVTATIKFSGITNFNGADIDIFAGGPGRFVVKTLSGVTTTLAAGYDIKLPANGQWFIGVGPAMPKGASGGKPVSLPGVPPSPITLEVSGLGGGTPTLSRPSSMPLASGVAFNDTTDIITFSFATADKVVTGTVKDGAGNVLSSIEVFMHRQGFGAPVFGITNASGTFNLSVSDYGLYEIGVFKDGMPPSFKQLEVKTDGSDADSNPDIFLQGKQITGSNPLVLTLKKANYTISGKVLDSSNSAVSYAPVFASDGSGNSVFGQTGSDGSYSVFVDAGTWTIRAELPPSKTGDTCGTFSKTVTVTTESQSSQNITPSTATCYTLSGSVTVGSVNLSNTPIFIEEWDDGSNKPVQGGIKRGTVTDSNGAYSAKVIGSKTYRIGTVDPTYGELSATKGVVSSDATQNISVASTSTVSFVFTGGTASMNGFIELKNTSDKTKRVTKQVTGLNTTTALTVEASVTYNYFVDVFGVGRFTGEVVAGNTATVNLGVSANAFITVTGTIYSNETVSSTVLAGTLVTFFSSSTGITQTATANASGTYSINIKAGTYEVSADIANYLPGQAAQITSFTTTTPAYDFGGASPDQGSLIASNRTIEGYVSSSAGATITDGYAWATNASGTVVTAAIDSTGRYSLPVTDGSWTVEAVAAGASETTKSGAVTISGSDSANNNFALTNDGSRIATSTSGIVAASSGGSVNDTTGTGIKISAGQGVLETGSGDVSISLEKTFTAPDTSGFDALANATFKISATGDSTIKDLNGNAEIQLDYSAMVSQIPSGVAEADLKLMYYSAEKGDYVPVEGGFTIDATNNTITGQVNHLTDFVIAYDPPAAAAAAASTGSSGTAAGGMASPVPAAQATTSSVVVNTVTTTASTLPVTNKIDSSKAYGSAPSVSVKVLFIHNLGMGSKGEEVRQLQAKLRELGFFKHPTNTGLFGPATKAAVVAFQKARGLKPYPGTLGPATRAALNSLTEPSESLVVPPVSTDSSLLPAGSTAGVFVSALKLGSKGEEVRQLQAKLRELGFFTYPNDTGVFGPATKAAVVAFQKAQGLKPYPGWVGPGTRAALNSL